MTRVVAIPVVVLASLAIVYGAWLLARDDPDGGRTPVGALSLALGAVLLLVAALLLRSHRGRASG